MSKFMGLGVLFAAAGVSAITLSQHNEIRPSISEKAVSSSATSNGISYDFAISCDVMLQNDLERDDFSNIDKSNARINMRDFYRVKWISQMPISGEISDSDSSKDKTVSRDECISRYDAYKKDLHHG